MHTNDEDLTRRAFNAYAQACRREGAIITQPDSSSGVVEHAGKLYVQLFNVNGTLAVYRVRNDGRLKGLRRWPAELD